MQMSAAFILVGYLSNIIPIIYFKFFLPTFTTFRFLKKFILNDCIERFTIFWNLCKANEKGNIQINYNQILIMLIY